MANTRLTWFIARLKPMSFPELIHRVVEVLQKSILQAIPEANVNKINLKVGGFYDPGMSWLTDTGHSGVQAQIILESGPTVFGRAWPIGADSTIQWHTSLNGERFDDVKTFKVVYRSTDSWKTDIRQLWELNRLVWLLPVAQHYASTNDGPTGEFLKSTLDSYFLSDKAGYSERWNSAIELAVQSLTLLSLEKILADKAESVIPKNYSSFLANRLRWLERFPSKYSSENNHRVAEVAAQIAIYARLGNKTKSQRKCEKELSSLILKQFANDGFNKEQSFDYHLFTLDLIATAKILVPELLFSDQAHSRLRKASQIAFDIYKFCEFWPSANDSDEAQVLGSIESDQKPAFQLFSWAFGDFQDLPQESRILHLKDSGYFFAKNADTSANLVLMVDHGQLGLAPLFAHAHADVQSIWLWADGEPILAEAGTYTYHSTEQFRRMLQGSLSHSSISINGQSIAEPAGPFLWDKSQLPHSGQFLFSETAQKLSIELSCNLPLKHMKLGPAIWQRNIEFGDGLLSVSDRLNSNVPYKLGSQFIFGPNFAIASEDSNEIRLKLENLNVDISGNGKFEPLETFSLAPRYSHLSVGLKLNASTSGDGVSFINTELRIWRDS